MLCFSHRTTLHPTSPSPSSSSWPPHFGTVSTFVTHVDRVPPRYLFPSTWARSACSVSALKWVQRFRYGLTFLPRLFHDFFQFLINLNRSVVVFALNFPHVFRLFLFNSSPPRPSPCLLTSIVAQSHEQLELFTSPRVSVWSDRIEVGFSRKLLRPNKIDIAQHTVVVVISWHAGAV